MPLTIYTSSAGSGKTYTLVREYIKLLISDPNAYRHILAITFTNKATEEMKSRIIEALSSLASYDHLENKDKKTSLLANDIIYSLGDANITHSVLRARAEQALYNILHNYSEFSISTIDSFFQQILRHFAKELKIPMRYELEMSSSYAVEQVVAKLMNDIGKFEQLTQWLEQYTFSQMDEGDGWKIENKINDLGKEIFREQIWERLSQKDRVFTNENTENNDLDQATTQENSDEISTDTIAPAASTTPNVDSPNTNRYQHLQKVLKQLKNIKRDVENKMSEYGTQALQLIAERGLVFKDFKSGTANWFEKIQKRDFERKSTLEKIIAGNTDEWRAKLAPNRALVDELVNNHLQQILIDAVTFFDAHEIQYNSAIIVLKSIYTTGVLADIQDKLKDYRSENNTILIADTNNILRAIVSQDDAPFIFEKVGNTYQHILIDEFQDTSNFQWLNLLPLIVNTLGMNKHAFIVGDAKQSIYRWRSGNMKLLLTGIHQQLANFFDDNTEQNLANNYRSHARIIEFNNAFFENAAQLLAQYSDLPPQTLSDLDQAYQTVAQGIVKTQGGYVEIAFMESQKSSKQTNDEPDDNTTNNSWKNKAQERLLQILDELQKDGFAYNDIAILTRTNTEGCEIAQLLGANSINVISSESLLLNNSPKVQLLVSAMQYIADRRNNIARAELLVLYTQLFPEKKAAYTYHQLCYDHKIKQQIETQQYAQQKELNNPNEQLANEQITNDENILQTAYDQILPDSFTQHLNDFVAQNLYDCVESLIQAFDLTTQADAYLQRFQDLALAQTTRKNADLRAFLAWWKDNNTSKETSIVIPEGENAVNIMTIHKAKGLEFPVLIIPYCDWSLTPKPDTVLWAQCPEKPFDQLGVIPIKASSKLEKTYFETLYQQEKAMVLIDNINILYVAFTRPTQRLYIMTEAVKSADNSIKRASKLLYETLRYFPYAKNFDLNNNLFTYGTPQAPTHHKQPEQINDLLSYPISRPYQSAINIRNNAKKYDTLIDPQQENAIKIGKKIHLALEKIKQPDDLDKILRQLQTKGLIEQNDIAFIKQRVKNIFEIPQVQHWFDPNAWDEILCEQSILRNDEKKIPDRIMIKGKKALIVDYKTGQRDEKHKAQVVYYANSLKKMNYAIEGIFLLYLSDINAEIVPVIPEIMPKQKKA